MVGVDLTGKTALVTGAGQGLGEAIAERLWEAGAAIAANYFPDPSGSNRRKAEDLVRRLGDRAAPFDADVRDAAAVGAMVSRIVERFDHLDIVVNCAGVLRDRTMKKMTDDDWTLVIETNMKGVFNVCRACAEVMIDGGRIVNLGSISAFLGFFGQANYAASKAGVSAMGKVLSRELARRRINVNTIAPGVVLTEMGLSIPESVRAEMLKSIPLGRFGEPREIADVVLFLCSDLGSYVTGQTIHVNGGWY